MSALSDAITNLRRHGLSRRAAELIAPSLVGGGGAPIGNALYADVGSDGYAAGSFVSLRMANYIPPDQTPLFAEEASTAPVALVSGLYVFTGSVTLLSDNQTGKHFQAQLRLNPDAGDFSTTVGPVAMDDAPVDGHPSVGIMCAAPLEQGQEVDLRVNHNGAAGPMFFDAWLNVACQPS